MTQLSSRLAWPLCAVVFTLTACALVLGWLSHTDPWTNGWGFLLAVLASAVVGGMVMHRRPENPVGWFFLGSALCYALFFFSTEYGRYGLFTHPGSLPLADLMPWVAEFLNVPGSGLLVALLPHYFPNGRLLSARWRPVAWLAGSFLTLTVLYFAFRPGNLQHMPSVVNPMGIEALRPFVEVLNQGMLSLVFVVVLLSVVGLVTRFRHSSGEERLQMKWLTYAIAAWFAGISLTTIIELFDPALYQVVDKALSFVFAGIPLSAGIAIFRYHLYDIDILINRTLVYTLLSGALLLIYFGSVVSIQQIFHTLTGQEAHFAIVLSTLASAALFNPLRRRIQDFIDQRFYRRKYNAQRTLASFSASLRDAANADLEHVTGELLYVIGETVQPQHVSLWLRKSE